MRLLPLGLALLAGASAEALDLPVDWLELEGSLEGRYVQRVHSSSPRENPQATLRLRPAADVTSWLRLKSAFTATAGGAPRDPDGPGVFNWDDTLQDVSPSLEVEESALELLFDTLDVRLGIQKFAWGKLDGIQPNDVVNPESFGDPILEDENDRKIGVPALSATAYLPSPPGPRFENLQLTGVWLPIVTAFRFADDDERWYPPIARVPPQSTVDGFTVRNEARVRNGDVPSRPSPWSDLRNGGGAGRFAGFLGGADFGFYLYDGYDTQPALDADARGFVRFDPTRPGCVPLEPECFDVRSEVDVVPVFQRVTLVGGDLAYGVLGATLRAEGAFVKNRLYPRAIRDIVETQEIGTINQALLLTGQEQEVEIRLSPVNVRRDGIEWGFGGDYLWNDTFLLLQLNQTIVLDNDVDLLISDTETRIAMTVRRSFFAERLEAELIGFYGMQGVYGVAHPRITYDLTDEVDVRVGYVLIEGHENSIIGQYKENDQGYVRLRLSF